MSLRPTSDAVPESDAIGTRRQSLEAAGHGAASSGTVALFHSAHDLHFANSTFTIAGRDVIHNHNIHYHSERPRDIWGILQSIPNFRKIYLDMIGKATQGTGMWLVKGDRFGIWLEPDGNIKIFWGSGIPGAGKTLLASIVIKHLETLYPGPDAKVCICYVYFRYSDHSAMKVRIILEILVMQTLERHPECQALIERTYGRHLRERTEPVEEQPLVLLGELAGHMACTFYILDALDEAPTNIQLALVKALASLNVKVFITSRPLRNVEAKFPHAQNFTIVAQDTDLDLHIAKVINESADLELLLEQARPSLKEEIISSIKQNCGGMFLHASLQMDVLRECTNAREVMQKLKDFPSKIEDVYLQTWDRILNLNAYQVSLAKAVLVWVLNASRSITVKELERAVATSPDTYKFEPDRLVPSTTLVSLCRGLITVEEESGIVRLVHYTAKDVLTSLLHESFPHPHSLLAAVCMAHLTECGFQNTTISSEKEFEAALENDPLLGYASQAWHFHARRTLDGGDSKQRTAQFVDKAKAFPVLVNPWSFDILTPLHTIGFYRLPMALLSDMVKSNPNALTAVRQQSPLVVASRSGHEDLVLHLIALSVIKVNPVDNDGHSALMHAASEGHEGIVKLLLAHPDIQVIQVNNKGWSTLMLAAQQGHKGVAKLLLAHPEIQANLVDNDGWSALMWAAYRGHEGVAELLLAQPETQVNLVDNSGFSALMWAAYRDHEGLFKLLLAHPEIQVNLIDKDGWSALMRAACIGHEGIVKLLLAHLKTQVNTTDNHGSTALLLAAQYGHTEIVDSLLTTGAFDVNAFDNDRDTAIKMAAGKGHEAVVRLLLNVPDVDMTIKSIKDGHTAMSAAQANGHNDIVELLQDFESRNDVITSLPEIIQLSLHNEDGSDSDSEAYYDAEEGSEWDGTLGSLVSES